MITNAGATRANAIPGRLKAIAISVNISIAYAGLSDQALTAIRKCWQAVQAGESISSVYSILQEASRQHDIDFVIASHSPDAELRKIRKGVLTNPLPETAIGDLDIVRDLEAKEAQLRPGFIPGIQPGELKFRSAFRELMGESGVTFNAEVGGVPNVLVCRPGDHHYEPHAGVTLWDTITIGVPETEDQLNDRASGKTQWKYAAHTARLSGVGVTGLRLQDAGIGFIHSPLASDDAVKVKLEKVNEAEQSTEFQEILERIAEATGGGVFVPSKPITPFEDIDLASLKKMAEHAETMAYKTTLSLHPDGLWLECCAPHQSRSQLLSFRGVTAGEFEEIVIHHIDELCEALSATARPA